MPALPKRIGVAVDLLEDIRIEEPDLARLPRDLMEATRRHFGGNVDWEPESAVTEKVLNGEKIPSYSPEHVWFLVDADLDVFSNGGEVAPWWRLGNFRRNGLGAILDMFEKDLNPGLRASYHTDDVELAERFGNRQSWKLYSPVDLKGRWVAQYGRAETRS